MDEAGQYQKWLFWGTGKQMIYQVMKRLRSTWMRKAIDKERRTKERLNFYIRVSVAALYNGWMDLWSTKHGRSGLFGCGLFHDKDRGLFYV